ncbi:MAG TPA: ATP-binding cassette domain-containing protein [Vicinamibacterales bacterium]|jgi:ABC-2 type transport system ATP-binding protein
MAAVLHVAGVRKHYSALRPLRINQLSIDPGERVSLSGLDAGAAEVLVNLVTGASVPDEGEVSVGGRRTAAIADGDDWLAWLDRFGIVSPRAVLLDAVTLLQNLAMPLTLQIDPMPADAAARATSVAREAGIDERWLDQPLAALSEAIKMRAHLVRAVMLNPVLLILEHPTATLEKSEGRLFGEAVARVAGARALATLAISEDAGFAAAAASRRLVLHAASGELQARRRGLFGW